MSLFILFPICAIYFTLSNNQRFLSRKSIRILDPFGSQEKSDGQKTVAFMLALPILPGRCQPSIVSRDELNYRVRNGNGWTLILISTNYCHPVSRINKQYKLVFAPCQYLLRFPCSELVTRTGFEPMLTA